jgi:hypothetical protein
MVEQLFTATGEEKGNGQDKEGTIVHCEEGDRDKDERQREEV